ncbi:unnamed protein product, partial [Didymodactylos carnosus]
NHSGGYYHAFRGTYVQVFNTSVLIVNNTDEINDYIKTIAQMITSITNFFAKKTLNVLNKTLDKVDSLPNEIEQFQKRMSFSATEISPTVNKVPVTMDKIKNIGMKLTNFAKRTPAAFSKLTTGAKQMSNETISTLSQAIVETALVLPVRGKSPSPSVLRRSRTPTPVAEHLARPSKDDRSPVVVFRHVSSESQLQILKPEVENVLIAPTPVTDALSQTAKQRLIDKMNERYKRLKTTNNETKCIFLLSPDIRLNNEN